MSVIIEEGLRQRGSNGITGWICLACEHHMTFLGLTGGCANCGKINHLQPVKTRDRLREETEAALDKQRWKRIQREFDPFDPISQMGRPLTTDQLLQILRKHIPALIARHTVNVYQHKVVALYIPDRAKGDKDHLTPIETEQSLRHVCNCEDGIMPEWDVMQRDEKGLPKMQIRGWRSVLGTFYINGLIPFIPDDGNRLSWQQVKLSRKKESPF
jgi:hypothetical protein